MISHHDTRLLVRYLYYLDGINKVFSRLYVTSRFVCSQRFQL